MMHVRYDFKPMVKRYPAMTMVLIDLLNEANRWFPRFLGKRLERAYRAVYKNKRSKR